MKFNNEIIEIEDQTISELLEKEGLNVKGIAVAVNNKVVKRVDWDTYIVTNADTMVVMTAAYGG